MKTPLSWKNLTTVAYVLIESPPQKDIHVRETSFPLAAGAARRRLRRRRLHQRMVVDLALEHLAVDRGKRLVENAAPRPAHQLGRQWLLPRHDVQHLGQFAIAQDLGALQVGAIRRPDRKSVV